MHMDGGNLLFDVGAGPGGMRMAIESSEFAPHLEELGAQDRAMLILAVVWKFSADDVAFCFGLSRPIVRRRIEELRVHVRGALERISADHRQRQRRLSDKREAIERAIRQRNQMRREREARRERARDKAIDRILFEKHRKQSEETMNQEPKIENVGLTPIPAEFQLPPIEDHVPVPVSKFGPREKGPWALLAEKMTLNQSVLVAEDDAKRLISGAKSCKKRMICRRDPATGKMRVWYVGPYEPKAKPAAESHGEAE